MQKIRLIVLRRFSRVNYKNYVLAALCVISQFTNVFISFICIFMNHRQNILNSEHLNKQARNKQQKTI